MVLRLLLLYDATTISVVKPFTTLSGNSSSQLEYGPYQILHWPAAQDLLTSNTGLQLGTQLKLP